MSFAQASTQTDDCIFMNRNGYLEETYFSWSMIPLVGTEGFVAGVYNPAFENTHQKLAERRLSTLREVVEKTALSRSVPQFWNLLIEGFKHNEYDAPFVLVYSSAHHGNGDSPLSTSPDSASGSREYYFEGALGVSAGHPSAPHIVDLEHGTRGFTSSFSQAAATKQSVVISEGAGTLDSELLEGLRWRGFGVPSRLFVILPIYAIAGEWPSGFLVVGTNPRRSYDDEYKVFLELLVRQLSASLGSVMLFEKEMRSAHRAINLAARDRVHLSEQLAVRTQEAVEIENKFTQMARLTPVGIFGADATGRITYCNEAWYKLSSYPRTKTVGDDWMDYIRAEDRDITKRVWATMLRYQNPISLEFRFKSTLSTTEDSMSDDVWVLANVHPDKDDAGRLKSFFGSLTNITNQKLAEGLQRRRMEEAMELKRQQETFMDMTSHEMRNPLSAILQCADEIASSLKEITTIAMNAVGKPLENSIDAAETILLCAQHQKRIIDDVLTLSKIDSAMLVVTPVDVSPTSVVRQALRIFRAELKKADISLKFHVHRSIRTMRLDLVRLDPSRLLQILINLINNAIKFTTGEKERAIRVEIAATKTPRAPEDLQSVEYVQPQMVTTDTTNNAAWGSGEMIYLHFMVQDTGRGLLASEKDRLFERFSQANPRTHIEYGGSGLGLFISRQLVELQGGAMGIGSGKSKGSTFTFYIQVRRSPHSRAMGADFNGAFASTDSLHPQQKLEQVEAAVRRHTYATSETRLNILIVEDNIVNQKVLARQVEKQGCQVFVANHGVEALSILRSSNFWRRDQKQPILGFSISVVLLDLEIPVMDGVTCAREIRALQRKGDIVGHVPLIATTGNARKEEIERALNAGVDDVLTKPFTVAELMPKVMELCRPVDNQNGGLKKASTAHYSTYAQPPEINQWYGITGPCCKMVPQIFKSKAVEMV